MDPFATLEPRTPPPSAADAETLALRVIAHLAADDALLTRFLDLSGLTGDQLRQGLASSAVQVAALDFLAGHEPDLMACADALSVDPASLMAARARL